MTKRRQHHPTILLVPLLIALAAGCGRAAEPETGAPRTPDDPNHPFPTIVPVRHFPPAGDIEWLNTERPLAARDLRGRFVLLDFWTYCCINCIHVLPELKKLEHAYRDELLVIGVHSAKFDTEKEGKNIADAIARYEIEHPVINDHDHKIWKSFGVRSWPTVLMIDPEGNAVYGRSGEFDFESFDEILKKAIPYYRDKGLLTAPKQITTRTESAQTPLRFPGKVLADPQHRRLFIADSNHNQIVMTDWEGKRMAVIGSGAIGSRDGDAQSAQFHHPQGMALHDDTLYVADTENHLIRKVDLPRHHVTTVAGLGEQGRNPWPDTERSDDVLLDQNMPWRGIPSQTPLNSPWALHVEQDHLYIAMAGSHQIWRMDLAETYIGPYAGNGREDIVDGRRLPVEPYGQGASSFAQPSGLASDGTWLYVADSEGSSIRAVPLAPDQEVGTVIGTSHISYGRLFTFGDQDGPRDKALLQHALGITFHRNALFIADTYNDKVKRVDATTGEVTTLQLRDRDDPTASLFFDEPAGISAAENMLFVADTNNHRVRVINLDEQTVSTLPVD